MSIGYALARAELVRVLTAYTGITTADGAADGTTLFDINLKDNPAISADAIPEKTILIMSGPAAQEDKGAASFVNATGEITLQGTGFSAQIKAGTLFRVLNISSVEIDVANINTKIGTNTDPAGTTTLFAWLAKLFTGTGQAQGLVYYGKVTQVDDETHFRVAGLAGFGDAYFGNNYRVYVVRDAAGGGAAPQGEMQPCSAYASTDAIFTHTAFTVSLVIDDEVLLLHERLAQIADIKTQTDKLAGLTTLDTFTYLDAGGEQAVFTITTTTRKKLHGFFLDFVNLTQDSTVRVKVKIDGTNYRTIESLPWSTSDDEGVYFAKPIAINSDLQVTMQEAVDEGADRNVPYRIILEDME
ncbi:hypothetical protein ES703_83709 [subsurface metagenome]